jgi:hypothetical protein
MSPTVKTLKLQLLIQHPERPRVVVLNFHNKELQFLLHRLPVLLRPIVSGKKCMECYGTHMELVGCLGA